MNIRKVFFAIGLLIAPLAGGSVYYLYHTQTKAVPVIEIKSNLGYPILPGTLITPSMVETKEVLQADLPVNPLPPNSLGHVYANEYIYPGDPVVMSKVTSNMPTTLGPDQCIIALKPEDNGILGFLQPGDIVDIYIGPLTIKQVSVFASTDDSGDVVNIVPEYSQNNQPSSGGILGVGSSNQQPKTPTHILVVTSKQDAQLLATAKKITIVFEKRPSLPNG